MLRKHSIIRRKSDDDKELNDKFENVLSSNKIYNDLFDCILGVDRKDMDDRYNLFDRAHFRSTYQKIFLTKYSSSDDIPSMFEEDEFYRYVQDFLKTESKESYTRIGYTMKDIIISFKLKKRFWLVIII